MFNILFVIILVALDQLSKVFVQSNMNLYESIPLIKNIFYITYIRNTGMIFGFMQGHNIYILLAILALIVVFFFIIKNDFIPFYKLHKHIFLFRFSTILLISGGLGNIIDRVYRGFVVDFFDLRNFAVFNVADSFISIAFGLLIIYFLNKKRSL